PTSPPPPQRNTGLILLLAIGLPLLLLGGVVRGLRDDQHGRRPQGRDRVRGAGVGAGGKFQFALNSGFADQTGEWTLG
ncbi:hypothetical protein, partial [Nonomuraea terrae]|uniref:hypothetical protein n=1 Tax=Nonomuraea terrae TaxID=2530383 RepID=UPI001CB72F9B